MRDRRILALAIAVLCLIGIGVAFPSTARAAARIVAPAEWSESSHAGAEAQRRASRWREALGLRLTQVASSPGDDRFAETVAVFEHTEPVPESAFVSGERAIATLHDHVAPLVGDAPPTSSGLREVEGNVAVAWGRWVVDDVVYECVLAPSGETTTIIILAALVGESQQNRAAFDAIIDNLQGVTPAMPAMSINAWRIGSVLAWLALALMLHALMLGLADREGDHRQAGQWAAGLSLVLIAVGTTAAGMVLQSREPAIVHAGSSLVGLVAWIGVAGLCVVGIHLLLALRFDQSIQSAPSSGTYSAESIRAAISSSAAESGAGPRWDEDDLTASSGQWLQQQAAREQLRATAEQAERAGDGDPEPSASTSVKIVIDPSEYGF